MRCALSSPGEWAKLCAVGPDDVPEPSESSHAARDDDNVCFHVAPEQNPNYVVLAVGKVVPYGADDSAYDAEGTEAEEPSNPQLAADVHLDLPEQHDRDRYEENVAYNIQHDVDVQRGELLFEPGVDAHGHDSLSEDWADHELCTRANHCTRYREHEDASPVHVQPPGASQELSEEEDETKLHAEYRGVDEHNGDSLIFDIIIQDVNDIGRRRYEICADVDFDLIVRKNKINHDDDDNENYICKKQKIIIDEKRRKLEKMYNEINNIDH